MRRSPVFDHTIVEVLRGDRHPAALDRRFDSDLARLGRSSLLDAVVIERIVTAVDATEHYFTELHPDDFFVDGSGDRYQPTIPSIRC